MYRVILSDNTALENLNGDWFDLISSDEITENMFVGKLSPVIVENTDSMYPSGRQWTNGKVCDIRHEDDGWHFHFEAITEQDHINEDLVERNNKLQEQNDFLVECLLEMSELVYAGEDEEQ